MEEKQMIIEDLYCENRMNVGDILDRLYFMSLSHSRIESILKKMCDEGIVSKEYEKRKAGGMPLLFLF